MQDINNKDLYNKYKHHKKHLNSIEVKQFKMEQHLNKHPNDYITVIANQKTKSEIARTNYKIKETEKLMEIGAYLLK